MEKKKEKKKKKETPIEPGAGMEGVKTKNQNGKSKKQKSNQIKNV